jgi:hypothetical protein
MRAGLVSGERLGLLVFDRGLDHGSGNLASIVQRCRRHWPRWVARGRRLANLGIHPPVISSPAPQDAEIQPSKQLAGNSIDSTQQGQILSPEASRPDLAVCSLRLSASGGARAIDR